MKLAHILFGTAVVLMPVSYATKSLLGLDDALWVDPSLVLASLAFLLLLPKWGDFLSEPLRPVFLCSFAISLVVIPAILSGLFLKPTPLIYNIFREPLRLWLILLWFNTSCWFLQENPRLVFRCTAIAVILALFSGLYLYAVVPGWVPANTVTSMYARLYFIRQAIWIDDFPIPRMGGLFIEAPPFGLFMFSAAIVLLIAKRSGRRSSLFSWALWFALLGTLLSLTDQVLLGAAVGLGLALPFLLPRQRWYFWPVLLFALAIPAGLIINSAVLKTRQFAGTPSTIYINGSSVGERTFHTRYALSMLTNDERATLFGFGPGRYGEYASESGYFPETVTMQFSALEILCEWGIAGFTLLGACCVLLFLTLFNKQGLFSAGLFLGLLLANSFQANWKWEGVFLAIAALYTGLFPREENRPEVQSVTT